MIVEVRIHRIIYGKVEPKLFTGYRRAGLLTSYKIEELNLLITDMRNRPFLTGKIKGLCVEV